MEVNDYYDQQARTGISGFRGSRYQKGGAWYDWILRKGLPVLKFLGKQALSGGLGVVGDLLEGDNLKTSAKKHLRQGGKNSVKFLADQMAGSGRRRRRVVRRRRRTPKQYAPKRRTIKRRTRKITRRTPRRRRQSSSIEKYGFY